MIRSCLSRISSPLMCAGANKSRIGASLVSRVNIQDSNSHLHPTRSFFTSSPSCNTNDNATYNEAYIEDNLKLDIKESENETIIEAIPIDTGRSKKLVKSDHKTACVLCRLNLRNLNYTDVMILSQFIKRNGTLATYHESKLCSKQYRKVVDLIRKAQRCNLIRRPPDYLVPGPWHDLNTYLEPDRRRDQPMKVIKKEYWKL